MNSRNETGKGELKQARKHEIGTIRDRTEEGGSKRRAGTVAGVSSVKDDPPLLRCVLEGGMGELMEILR